MEYKTKKLGDIIELTMGQSPSSKNYTNNPKEGMPFSQGSKDFGFRYPNIQIYTREVKKISEKNTVLMSVRAPVGDLNICNEKMCIGRGLCSINMKNHNNIFLYYLLKYYVKNIINKENGTIFDSISKKDILNLKVTLPINKIEQNKLIFILNKIDKKIEVNRDINQNLYFYL